jgi:hypothetical protein
LALRLIVEKNAHPPGFTRRPQAETIEAGRDVLEHLHAGDDVEALGHLLGQRLDRDLAVGDARRRRLDRVELRHLERLVGEVDAEHVGAAARHRIGEDAAAAADVENALALERREAVDPVERSGLI